MKISNWYTVRQHVLVQSGTDEKKKMCYGMSTGSIRRIVYEMVEKNNVKDNEL